MSIKFLALILGSVSLSALAQLLLKAGMASAPVQSALSRGALEIVWTVAVSLPVIAGLALYGLGAALWLLVLARVDVGYAYPFVGLGFVLTMALGWLVLHEPLGLTRVAGTLLVAVGVYLVAQS